MTDRGDYLFTSGPSDASTRARTGVVRTPHGSFHTPAFMPVGTKAAVKGLRPDEVVATGAEIVLANTYHLHLRPGEELIEKLGGVQDFMSWDGPILTDSGGYQVFSLSELRTIHENGVAFKSHLDGSPEFLGPDEAMHIQIALGSDIMMSFDECMPYPIDRAYAEESLERTHRWEKRTLELHPRDGRALFGIVQGGVFEDLRRKSTETLLELPFDGYAMGGLFIGEARDQSMEMADIVGAILPDTTARYVMGVGTPLEILDLVALGWDMFDCVLPTRNARHGVAMTFGGTLRLKNARFFDDAAPVEAGCPCVACRDHSRAYLRHLFLAKEMLGPVLLTSHNLTFMQRLMSGAREAIGRGEFASYVAATKAAMRDDD